MCKESCFCNSFGPRVSPPLLCAGDDETPSVCTVVLQKGGRGEGAGLDGAPDTLTVEGTCFFGNLLCRTVLRHLNVFMVILSFPKGAPQERAAVGMSQRCLPRDAGRCVHGSGSLLRIQD